MNNFCRARECLSIVRKGGEGGIGILRKQGLNDNLMDS